MLDTIKHKFRENPFEASLWYLTLLVFFVMAILLIVVSLQFQLSQTEGGFQEYSVFIVRMVGTALLFSIIAALPYFIGYIAAKESNLAWLFLVISLGIGAHQAMLTFSILFSSESSTAVLGLVYYGIYYTMIISVIWGIVAGGRMISRKLKEDEGDDDPESNPE
jgi:hypothetical protein